MPPSRQPEAGNRRNEPVHAVPDGAASADRTAGDRGARGHRRPRALGRDGGHHEASGQLATLPRQDPCHAHLPPGVLAENPERQARGLGRSASRAPPNGSHGARPELTRRDRRPVVARARSETRTATGTPRKASAVGARALDTCWHVPLAAQRFVRGPRCWAPRYAAGGVVWVSVPQGP